MPPVTSESVGLSSARLARIRPAMQAYVDQGKYAGLLTLVARRGALAHLECFGLADREAQVPMRPDAIFRIYSMSKPITCLALLMLYEEGRFQLGDPLSRYIPGFKAMQVAVPDAALPGQDPSAMPPHRLEPACREITIRDLLTHTSGLSYPNPEGLPAERLLAQASRELEKDGHEPSLAEWAARLCTVPLVCQPGSRFQYGYSHDVVGHLVELLSGQPFDAFLQERIFNPLGMPDTGFWVPPEKLARLTAMYASGQQGGLELTDPPAGHYSRPRRFLSGGGGLVSTAQDYFRFCQMLLNMGQLDGVRLLGRKTVELMTANHLPPSPFPTDSGADQYESGYGYGLGVRVLLDVARSRVPGSVGEHGWAGYAGTYYWIDPREELIGLVMPQLEPRPGVEHNMAMDFRVLAYQAIVD